MTSQMKRILVLAFIFAFSSQAWGDIVVEYYSGSNCFKSDTQILPSGSDVPVELDSSDCTVLIYNDSPSEDIGTITVTGTGTNDVWILVTTDLDTSFDFPDAPACDDWGGLVDLRGNVDLKARITGDLTGAIDVEYLQYLYVDGAIQHPVESDGGSFRVRAGSTTPQGDLIKHSEGGGGFNHVEVRITDGDLGGDVRAMEGAIRVLEVQKGDIGTPSSTAQIEAADDFSGNHIDTMEVAGDVYADIDADISTLNPDGQVGTLDVDGHLHGSVRLGSFQSLDIAGSLNSSITHANPLALDRTLFIGVSLNSSGLIDLPAQGLEGQIILNASGTTGMWDGDVEVGPETLSQLNYSQVPADLGGGSAGLAPFDLHDEASSPPSGSVLANEIESATLRNYGPVHIKPQSPFPADPVVIERRRTCLQGAWEDVTNDFDFDVDSDDARNLTIEAESGTPGFEGGYEYRIDATDDLLCVDVTGNPAVFWLQPYFLTIEDSCPADIAGSGGGLDDGVVDVLDLLALLNDWGDSGQADIDCNGVVDVSDLIDLLDAWGPCPGESGNPKSLQQTIEDAGLDWPDDWDEFEDVMTNGTESEKDRYSCWMHRYLHACNCRTCPGSDPFAD